MGEKLEGFIQELEVENKLKVNYVRCDNSGENSWIKQNLLDNGVIENIECMEPHTPKQNRMVERELYFLYSNVRATLNKTNISGFFREKLWA